MRETGEIMDNKEKMISEIVNAREMIEMLLYQIGKLEERTTNGAIKNEDAIEYAQSWQNAIKCHYVEIDILKKKLFD